MPLPDRSRASVRHLYLHANLNASRSGASHPDGPPLNPAQQRPRRHCPTTPTPCQHRRRGHLSRALLDGQARRHAKFRRHHPRPGCSHGKRFLALARRGSAATPARTAHRRGRAGFSPVAPGSRANSQRRRSGGLHRQLSPLPEMAGTSTSLPSTRSTHPRCTLRQTRRQHRWVFCSGSTPWRKHRWFSTTAFQPRRVTLDPGKTRNPVRAVSSNGVMRWYAREDSNLHEVTH